MALKIKRFIPMLLLISVLFSACSKDKINSETGYYMRTDHGDFILFVRDRSFSYPYTHIEINYEPVEIYFAEGKESEVPMDSLKTGDKIEVDIGEITASYPESACIYGLRLIEEGDISNIAYLALSYLENFDIHAVIGEKTEQPMITRHSGYFVRTETECFLVPAEKISGSEFVKIHPASEFGVSGVSLGSFKTGDRIWVDIMLVQELYPPIAPIFGTALIEEGDISCIDEDVLSKLSELGYTTVEAE